MIVDQTNGNNLGSPLSYFDFLTTSFHSFIPPQLHDGFTYNRRRYWLRRNGQSKYCIELQWLPNFFGEFYFKRENQAIEVSLLPYFLHKRFNNFLFKHAQAYNFPINFILSKFKSFKPSQFCLRRFLLCPNKFPAQKFSRGSSITHLFFAPSCNNKTAVTKD